MVGYSVSHRFVWVRQDRTDQCNAPDDPGERGRALLSSLVLEEQVEEVASI